MPRNTVTPRTLLGALGAIGLGWVLQSFSAEPDQAAAATTAVAASAAFGAGVMQNMAANSVAALCSRWAAGTDDERVNHDLAKLFIESVAETLRRIADTTRPDPVSIDLATKLLGIADELPGRWFKAYSAGKASYGPQFNEQKFVDLFRFGHAAEDHTPPVGEPGEWVAFIEEHAPWERRLALVIGERSIVDNLMRTNFAAAARDRMRIDFTELNRSYPALVIRLLSEIAQAHDRFARKSAADHDRTQEAARQTGRVIILAQARAEAILQRLDARLAAPLKPTVTELGSLETRFWARLDELLGAVREEGRSAREHVTVEMDRGIAEMRAIKEALLAESKARVERAEQPGAEPAKGAEAVGQAEALNLAAAANIIRMYDADRLDQARAAITARDFDAADTKLDELKHSTAYSQTFAFKMVEGHRWYEVEDFAKAGTCFRTAVLLDEENPTARVWLGSALQRTRDERLKPRIEEACLHYSKALAIWTREAAPVAWAMTQNNLGIAWREYPELRPRIALDKAIACFVAALEILTPETTPIQWASTQNNLGNAWREYPEVNRRDALDRAIACFTAALSIRTRAAMPRDWATTQNNLGNAWQEYPDQNRVAILDKAITCYTAALSVNTHETAPMEWATTQNNLGNAWQEYPSENRRTTLDKAIACYTTALSVRTRETAPMQWATTQSNLGTAWKDYPGDDRQTTLDNAISCFVSVLDIWTREAAPMHWAIVQNNLGTAWRDYPSEDQRVDIDKAIAYFSKALEVFTREATPARWATTQNNLGVAYRKYPAENRRSTLDKAIVCFTAALSVKTREAAPVDWALTQNNLGNVWHEYPDDKSNALDKAITCYAAALEVLTSDRFPWHHSVTSRNLKQARAQRAAL